MAEADGSWDLGKDELIVISQLLLIGGLTYVLFCINRLVEKPPLMIKCECFNDMSHDDMVKVKDMYKSMLEQQQKQQKSTEEQEKEVDNLNKED
jgi:hypothetical protein